MKKLMFMILSLLTLSSCTQFNTSLDSRNNASEFSISEDSSKEEETVDIEKEIMQWEKKGYVCDNNLVYSNEYNNQQEYFVVGYYGKPKSIVIPEYFNDLPVTQIKWAFVGCSSLEKLFISKNITSIWESSFDDCISLKEIVIDENNSSFFLDNGLLYKRSNDGLLSLIISLSSVKGKVTLLEETVYINHYAFATYPQIEELYLGKNISYINSSATFEGLDHLNYIEVDKENSEYATIDGVLFSKDLKDLIFISPTRHIDYKIPETVESVYGSFEKCTKLKNLTINKNISKVYPLYSQTYENVYVSEENPHFTSVDGILYSKDLKTVLLVPPMKVNSALLDSVIEIASYAFLENSNEKIVLPDSVILINDYAFPFHNLYLYNEQLKEITIGKNVTKIGTCAFDGTINLKTVNYKGNQESFSQIEILEYNDYFLNADIIYNYE